LLALAVAGACQKSEKGSEKKVDCTNPVRTWIDTCGFTVKLDGVDALSYDDALGSCQAGGKLWDKFRRCYDVGYLDNDNSCEAFAECVPEHGFEQDDDTADDDADDDTVDDDTVDDDTVDDDTVDDDTIDDDTVDDDTADDDSI
jgi:hypothetical protein